MNTTDSRQLAERLRSRRLLIVVSALLALLALGVGSPSAFAAPALRVTTGIPDYVTPGKGVSFYISVRNVGDEAFSGNATLKYTFPVGLSLGDPIPEEFAPSPLCTPSGQVDECQVDLTGIPPQRSLNYQTFSTVDPGAAGALNGEIEVSGGGAVNVVRVPFSFNTGPIGPFAIKSLDVSFVDGPILPGTQAGSPPRQIDAGFEVVSKAVSNFGIEGPGGTTVVTPPESIRDVITHLPAGMIGNPMATPLKCTAEQLSRQSPALGAQVPVCPADSQIGIVLVNGRDIVPLYNLTAPRGVPAQFGFYYIGIVSTLHARLRPSDNGVDIVSEKASSTIPIQKVEATFWGAPADSANDRLRADCLFAKFGNNGKVCRSQAPNLPFLRLPTSCSSAPLPWSMEIDTYQHPGAFHTRATTTPPLEGCDKVPFEPGLSIAPSTGAAHSPTGLDVELTIPQDSGPNGISQADLRKATVTLPKGVSINPASAEGLAACSDAQLRLGLEGPSECPEASKLGSVEIDTPLLDHPISGSVYLRTQASNNPESGDLYRLAIELRSEEDGIDIKLPGSLAAAQKDGSGQLTASFDQLPQLPFESMQAAFQERAAGAADNTSSLRYLCGRGHPHRLERQDRHDRAEPEDRPGLPGSPVCTRLRSRCHQPPCRRLLALRPADHPRPRRAQPEPDRGDAAEGRARKARRRPALPRRRGRQRRLPGSEPNRRDGRRCRCGHQPALSAPAREGGDGGLPRRPL